MSVVLGATVGTIPLGTGSAVSGLQPGSSVTQGLGTGSSGIPSVLGLSSVVAALVEVTAIAATLSLGIIIIAVVANRADPARPGGDRIPFTSS